MIDNISGTCCFCSGFSSSPFLICPSIVHCSSSCDNLACKSFLEYHLLSIGLCIKIQDIDCRISGYSHEQHREQLEKVSTEFKVHCEQKGTCNLSGNGVRGTKRGIHLIFISGNLHLNKIEILIPFIAAIRVIRNQDNIQCCGTKCLCQQENIPLFIFPKQNIFMKIQMNYANL